MGRAVNPKLSAIHGDTVSRNTPDTSAKHLLIGLTGGIGSGKSTVAALFAKLGARIVDSDELSHALTQSGGAAIAAIRDTFGGHFIDAAGALDRARMRELVFAHAAEKKRLEAILHPLILAQTRQLAEASTSAPYTLVSVPLLFEAEGYRNWLRRTLIVDCPEEMQIERTMRRNGLDKSVVMAIISQQMARHERQKLADDIIHNESDLPALSRQVEALHNGYLKLASLGD